MIEAIRENPDEFHINENENVTRDGRRLWIAWRNTYIEEGLDGKPELLSVGVDITERKRVEDALHVLASTTDPIPGDTNVLERSIRHLALAYGVQYAFYATFTDDSRERVEIQAMWDGKSITRGHVYDLEGTPCADVVRGRANLIREGVAERYPNDSTLREWGIESYFGSRLKGLQNEVIGLIVIMDTRPLELPSWKRYLLRVFAARIGGELQRRRAEEDVYRLAHYDILTGLPNRLLFHDRLEQAMVHALRNDQCLALLFIDLDRFKHVNDTLGHAGGDLLLREVAGRLTALLRRSDTVARLGGDEFTILMTDFDSESAMLKIAAELSHRIIKVLGEPFHIDNAEMFISASVGITCFPADGVNIDYLVRNADLAMYKAKEQGRNCFEFYRPEFNEVAERRARMESELRAAIGAGEMQLHYQPIIDVEAGTVVGLEALVRWLHPQQGLVLPGDFVGLAEESGLMLPLGEWVIDTACRQLGAWRRAGVEVGWLSINLSLRQLTRGNLLEVLEAARKRYGVAAGAGDHRDHLHAGPGKYAAPAAAVQGTRLWYGHGRLRYRLFLVRAAEEDAGEQPQDRPQFRAGHGRGCGHGEHRRGHDRNGTWPRSRGGGGGGGDAGSAAGAPGTGMPLHAGPSLCPPHGRRRLYRLPLQPPCSCLAGKPSCDIVV
ncbi:MAG: hypothetical protein DSZ02_06845 [Gammaproteobacteria bacterium]|nr:MAG: hypothetical protein DSZ02_06845 [Gammaproteobacteria bacterium]